MKWFWLCWGIVLGLTLANILHWLDDAINWKSPDVMLLLLQLVLLALILVRIGLEEKPA